MNNIILSNQSSGLTSPKEKKLKNNTLDIKKIKKNTINSLNEVETFLNNFQKFKNYIKLYKILK